MLKRVCDVCGKDHNLTETVTESMFSRWPDVFMDEGDPSITIGDNIVIRLDVAVDASFGVPTAERHHSPDICTDCKKKAVQLLRVELFDIMRAMDPLPPPPG